MAAAPVEAEVLKDLARNAPPARPRPGHADLAGMQKYGFDEAWPILERAGETAARVAPGAIARSCPKETAGIEIVSHVVEPASAKAPYGVYPTPADVARLDAHPVRCLDADTGQTMAAEIDQAHKDGDTLGGVLEVPACGVPVGLGSHVQGPQAGCPADRRADGHSGAQGRGGRRRVRAGPGARFTGP